MTENTPYSSLDDNSNVEIREITEFDPTNLVEELIAKFVDTYESPIQVECSGYFELPINAGIQNEQNENPNQIGKANPNKIGKENPTAIGNKNPTKVGDLGNDWLDKHFSAKKN